MQKIIKAGSIIEDSWQFAVLDEQGQLQLPMQNMPTIISFAQWLSQKDRLSEHKGELALHVLPDIEVEEIAPYLDRFSMIAIDFPHFTDGRGYSTARLLRERYGYSKEIRAVGNIGKDQLFYLSRCGFNAFALPENKNLEQEIKGLTDFSECYQTTVDKQPVFSKRAQIN